MTEPTLEQMVERLRRVAPEAMRPKSLTALLLASEYHVARELKYDPEHTVENARRAFLDALRELVGAESDV